MRTLTYISGSLTGSKDVGMKPLSERDENKYIPSLARLTVISVGMKPLSERDENFSRWPYQPNGCIVGRNEATL